MRHGVACVDVCVVLYIEKQALSSLSGNPMGKSHAKTKCHLKRIILHLLGYAKNSAIIISKTKICMFKKQLFCAFLFSGQFLL